MIDAIASGFVSGGITLVGSFLVVGVWHGYHKKRHENIDAELIEQKNRLDTMFERCETRTAQCPIVLVKDRQDSRIRDMGTIEHKLDSLLEQTGRIGNLEYKMDTSEMNRDKMNEKLDALVTEVSTLRGMLEGKGII